MRINGKKVIALAITIVMLCLQPAQSLSGTHVEAESRQQYVARLKQFDSVKKQAMNRFAIRMGTLLI